MPRDEADHEPILPLPIELAEANILAASTEKNHLLKVQPFRFLYLVWMLLSTVLFLVPVWMVWYSRVENRPRPNWPVSRAVRVRAMRRVQGLVARLELDHLGRDLSVIPDPSTLIHSSHTHIPPLPPHLLHLRGFPLLCLQSLVRTRGSWATPHPPIHTFPWTLKWLREMFENHKRRKLGGSRLVRRGRERRWKKGVLPWEKGGASSGTGTPTRSPSNDGERREPGVAALGLKELTLLEELGEEELEEGGAGFWFGKRRGEGLGRGEEGEREGALVGLSFHGGAFVAGTSLETDGTANIPKHLISRTAIKDVLSVDYRLAHCNPFPYALIDALAAYHYLLVDKNIPAERIVVIGDSAGGHLALTLVRYLRDEGPSLNLPMPGGMILFSPWCDMSFSVMGLAGSSGYTNRHSDIINDSLPPYSVSLYLRSIPSSFISSPYLSPCGLHLPHDTTGRGSFEGFPKTFVVAGEAERLRDEIRELVGRLRSAKVLCGYEETYGAMHDFPIFPFQIAEMKSAFRALSSWIDNNLVASPSSLPTSLSTLTPNPTTPTTHPSTLSTSDHDEEPSLSSPPNGDESFVGAVAGISGDVLEMFGSSLDGLESPEETENGDGEDVTGEGDGEDEEEEEDGGRGQMRTRRSVSGRESSHRRRASWLKSGSPELEVEMGEGGARMADSWIDVEGERERS